MGQNNQDRETMLATLTGIHASKLSYYSELKEKVAELEARNQQILEAKQMAEAYCEQLSRTAEELSALYEASRRQALRLDRALASLKSISQVLTTTTQGVDALLQAVVRTAAELFETDYAVIALGPDLEAPQMVYCAYRLPGRAMPATLPDPLHHLIVSVMEEPKALHRVSEEDQTYSLCVPMFREKTLAGALCLQTRDGCDFDDSDLAMLQTLANQAAVAIENARLFEETRRLHAETTRLYQLAVQEKEQAERKTRELEEARAELSLMQREQILSEERNRIARELHDSVAQILTSIGLNLEWCRQQLPEDSLVYRRILDLKQLARSGIYEVRNTIFELSSVHISETGLVPALQELLKEFERTTDIVAELTVNGQVQRLPLPVETALYRVTREALYNVFKHAQASRVNVSVAFRPGRVRLQVTDNGVGIAPAAIERCQEGLTSGLRNMVSRMEEVGGELIISNLSSDGQGQGTSVAALVPRRDRPIGDWLDQAGVSASRPTASPGWSGEEVRVGTDPGSIGG